MEKEVKGLIVTGILAGVTQAAYNTFYNVLDAKLAKMEYYKEVVLQEREKQQQKCYTDWYNHYLERYLKEQENQDDESTDDEEETVLDNDTPYKIDNSDKEYFDNIPLEGVDQFEWERTEESEAMSCIASVINMRYSLNGLSRSKENPLYQETGLTSAHVSQKLKKFKFGSDKYLTVLDDMTRKLVAIEYSNMKEYQETYGTEIIDNVASNTDFYRGRKYCHKIFCKILEDFNLSEEVKIDLNKFLMKTFSWEKFKDKTHHLKYFTDGGNRICTFVIPNKGTVIGIFFDVDKEYNAIKAHSILYTAIEKEYFDKNNVEAIQCISEGFYNVY